MFGKLYICPTPIGNLDDITIRTLKVLESVDLIVAEDTRHTIKLLNHFSISKPLISYHEHNKKIKGQVLLEKLFLGNNIALVSDAGMPGISDPGADMVKLCIENGVDIEILPGASAFVVALVGSGIDTRRFCFEGFLGRDKRKKKKRLEELKNDNRTIIFYESPHRLKATLKCINDIFGNRKISLCRELTKKYEEYFRTDVVSSIEYYDKNEARGEYILVVEGNSNYIENKELYSDLSDRDYVKNLINEGLTRKEAIKKVAKDRGLKKDIVYKQVMDL